MHQVSSQTVSNYFQCMISSPRENIQSSKRANKKWLHIADFGRKFSHSARVTKMTNLICLPRVSNRRFISVPGTARRVDGHKHAHVLYIGKMITGTGTTGVISINQS